MSFIITFRVIIRIDLVTPIVIAFKAVTFVKSFANAVLTAKTDFQDAGVKPNVIPSSVPAFWLCVNAIRICVQNVELINMMSPKSTAGMLFKIGDFSRQNTLVNLVNSKQMLRFPGKKSTFRILDFFS